MLYLIFETYKGRQAEAKWKPVGRTPRFWREKLSADLNVEARQIEPSNRGSCRSFPQEIFSKKRSCLVQ